MRWIQGEAWPSCDFCERQLPTLDDASLERIGWAVLGDQHICPSHQARILYGEPVKPVASGAIPTVYCGSVIIGGPDAHLGAVRDDCA